MELNFKICKKEIEEINEFINNYRNCDIYKERMCNIKNRNNFKLDKEYIWKNMIHCLMSSQQKSDDDKPVSRFFRSNPYLLAYSECESKINLKDFADDVIVKFGGIRWHNKIAEAIEFNYNFLIKDGWDILKEKISILINSSSKEEEREVVELFMGKEKGFHQFGPKQVRNFFQLLGLTKYEIPIDSRMIKWLNERDFPIHLESNSISNKYIYNFILDKIQEICREVEILPTLFDAAVFGSFEK